jgi:hypothetical protein
VMPNPSLNRTRNGVPLSSNVKRSVTASTSRLLSDDAVGRYGSRVVFVDFHKRTLLATGLAGLPASRAGARVPGRPYEEATAAVARISG